VIVLVTVTKNDVILNDNYRGTKILVKHYKPFNRDSIYLAYPKPVTNVMKITEVKDRQHLVVKFDNGERWRVSVTNAEGYKVGQSIKSIKEYYPKENSIIVGQEHTRWLEKLK
jgi:16S rRNA C1402 (ribose-2'-O) methylase RsmI